MAIPSCGGRLKAPESGAFFCLEIVAQNPKKTAALQLHLKTGEVVFCDFDGLHEPEMVKRRPVIVISRTATHWRNLCTIVPLSSTAPERRQPWHVELSRNPLRGHLPGDHPFQLADQVWAKCDMLYTMAFDRITRPHVRQGGQRSYPPVRLPGGDLAAVFEGVRAYLPTPPASPPVTVPPWE